MSDEITATCSFIAHLVRLEYAHSLTNEGQSCQVGRKRASFMGSREMCSAKISLSYGDFGITLKPSSEFQGDQHQPANDAALNAAMAIVPWTTDNAVEPKAKGGKQQQFTVGITDGSRQIATIEFDVPTTDNFGLGMYKTYIDQTIKPAVLQAYRSFPSTRASQKSPTPPTQQHLAEDALSSALDKGRDITPKQLIGSNR